MLEVTVVGGVHCRRAKLLKERLAKVAADIAVPIHIHEATDVLDPLRFGLLGLPALLIGGDVLSAGHVPSERELRMVLMERKGARDEDQASFEARTECPRDEEAP